MLPVLLLLAINSASAWWCYGHMATAMVALLDLQNNAPDILEKVNEINMAFSGNYTHGLIESMVSSACYPDDVKEYGMHAMDDWHFVNKPYNVDGILNIMENSNGDGLWAINETMKTLSHHDWNLQHDLTYEKSFALKYLIHIVGDLHQPLHVTEMFSNAFPEGDLGGNRVYINAELGINELHALWDSGCYALFDAPVRPLNQTGWDEIETTAKNYMAKFSRTTLADELSEKERQIWADDNFHLAIKYSYTGIEEHGYPTKAYISACQGIVQQQIALGGYRLSDLLQEALAKWE